MRVALFIGLLFVISAVSALDFNAVITITGGGLIGTETGKIWYRGTADVNNQKQRLEVNDPKGNVVSTEVYDVVTDTAVTFANCGGGCKASAAKTAFPKYWKDGQTANGTEVVNGVTCQKFKQTAEPTIISYAGDIPCRAVFGSGAVYTFSSGQSGGVDGKFSTAGWNCPEEKCEAPLNVVLVMDRSGSISNTEWTKFRGFAIKVVQGFDISPTGVNIGAALFSSSANVGFNIQNIYQNAYNAILGLQRGGVGSTCIGCGLTVAKGMLDKHTRKAQNVYIVMTDGQNNVGRVSDAVTAIGNTGTIFAVGIGAADANSLKSFADPDKIFYVSDFDQLDTILGALIRKTCSISSQLTPGANECGSGCRGSCNCGECECPSTCDDGNKCTTDTCNAKQNGAGCQYSPVNCDDSDACTIDSCSASTGCLNAKRTCDDNNKCTVDTCDKVKGCIFSPLTCDTGDKCKIYDCDPATGCTSKDVVCNDNNPCTVDSCDPKTGCKFVPLVCDDGQMCTADTCDPKSTNLTNPCVYKEVSSCMCQDVVCTPVDICNPSKCDPNNGTCIVTTGAQLCNDNNVCTQDTCAVVGSKTNCSNTYIPCTTTNKCLVPSCDPVKGCQYTNLTCDDGSAFTNDTCDPAIGCQFTPKNCDDKNACTKDSFNETLKACVNTPVADDYCNDYSVCTVDKCEPAVGCVFTPINCSSSFCDEATCHSVLGCTNTTRECIAQNHCKYGFCDNALAKCSERDFDSHTGGNETEASFVCDSACSTIECQFAALSSAEKAAVISAAAIAGIAVGAAAGAVLLGYGGKKGYDYLKTKNSGEASLGNNPLYVEDNRQGANPLYKE